MVILINCEYMKIIYHFKNYKKVAKIQKILYKMLYH